MNSTNKVVNAYAKSLFQKLKNSQYSSYEVSKITSSETKTFASDIYVLGEELLLIKSILGSSKKLKSFFKNPTYSEKQKLDIILTLFPGLSLTIKSFLQILAERSHLFLLPEISDEYNKNLLNFKNIKRIKLITASPLDENFGPMLLNNLKKLTNANEIILSIDYNPKLLGGLIVEYDSVAIDASILNEFSLFFSEV